jgi:hypothetical protein
LVELEIPDRFFGRNLLKERHFAFGASHQVSQ